jgi:hypothetical protein
MRLRDTDPVTLALVKIDLTLDQRDGVPLTDEAPDRARRPQRRKAPDRRPSEGHARDVRDLFRRPVRPPR